MMDHYVIGEAEVTGTNGDSPEHAEHSLSFLRRRPDNPHVFRGFGPLVVGVVLFVLMLLLAPTVAPERVVDRPATSTTVVGQP